MSLTIKPIYEGNNETLVDAWISDLSIERLQINQLLDYSIVEGIPVLNVVERHGYIQLDPTKHVKAISKFRYETILDSNNFFRIIDGSDQYHFIQLDKFISSIMKQHTKHNILYYEEFFLSEVQILNERKQYCMENVLRDLGGIIQCFTLMFTIMMYPYS